MQEIKQFFQQLTFRRTLLMLIIFLVIYEIILYFGIGLPQPLWADEHHFVETILDFDRDLSLHQLKTYNELSTPLPFILYALWGKITGFELHQLRLLSLFIAFLTFITFFIFYHSASKRPALALLITVFLIFQPYMIGLTIFVYTDMLAMLFLALSLIAIHKRQPVFLAISVAGTLLCRQYFVFLPTALGIYYFLQWAFKKHGDALKLLTATLISLIPALLLFILWEGFTPQSEIRQVYLAENLHFHPDFLVLYICILVVYLFPIIIYRWRHFIRDRKIIVSAIILSPIYFIWPVAASKPAQAVEVYTVGFFHKFVRLVVGNTIEHIIFYLIFLLSLVVLLSILKDFYQKIKQKDLNGIFLTELSIISFLVIMPFSYLNWEKYFLPIIPFALIPIIDGYFFKKFDPEADIDESPG